MKPEAAIAYVRIITEGIGDYSNSSLLFMTTPLQRQKDKKKYKRYLVTFHTCHNRWLDESVCHVSLHSSLG